MGLAAAAVMLLGGHDRPDQSAAPQAVADAAAAGDQRIGVEYACGNSFVITSENLAPVKVAFRVRGSKEEGSVMLPAAPHDPHFSEALIETRSTGAVEVFVGDQLVGARENGKVPCGRLTTQAVPIAAASPQSGAWSAPFSWPIVAIHQHLLPNGRVLSFGLQGVPYVWNPATGTFTRSPSEDWVYCSGHAFLPDGRLLLAGGNVGVGRGLPDINLYSSGAGWVGAQPMAYGRWYPTVTTMGDGQVAIVAGQDDRIDVPIPEVWSSGTVRRLSSASRALPIYPRAFLAPNGKLFYAGEAQPSLYLDITGAGRWTTVGDRRVANREYGSAMMYEPGKVLYAGGGRTTNTAEVIDLNQASPAWRATGLMAFARRNLNLTMLPTGEVLATGGTGGAAVNDLTKAVRSAEIWNPNTGTWRTLASGTVRRGYHSTSILLPDGRVLHAGSGDAVNAPRELSAKIFSPPYLFAGTRPTITNAPGTASYGTTFRVTTPDASAITKVSLIRLGSTTHAFDMNQRYQTLAFTRDATGLMVTAPTSRNLTPPGHYMLFILNGSGVPSVAKIVQVSG